MLNQARNLIWSFIKTPQKAYSYPTSEKETSVYVNDAFHNIRESELYNIS